MKKLIIILSLAVSAFVAEAQNMDASTFDFWEGTWELRWTDANGQAGSGTNVINRISGGKVLHENFSATKGQLAGFQGTSISVFNPNTSTWHQTWMDNQGGNLIFTGSVEGDRKIFSTASQTINGQTTQSRMVFYSFTEDSFTWDWERTTDGGKTWTLNWRIFYKRIK